MLPSFLFLSIANAIALVQAIFYLPHLIHWKRVPSPTDLSASSLSFSQFILHVAARYESDYETFHFEVKLPSTLT